MVRVMERALIGWTVAAGWDWEQAGRWRQRRVREYATVDRSGGRYVTAAFAVSSRLLVV